MADMIFELDGALAVEITDNAKMLLWCEGREGNVILILSSAGAHETARRMEAGLVTQGLARTLTRVQRALLAAPVDRRGEAVLALELESGARFSLGLTLETVRALAQLAEQALEAWPHAGSS